MSLKIAASNSNVDKKILPCAEKVRIGGARTSGAPSNLGDVPELVHLRPFFDNLQVCVGLVGRLGGVGIEE
jgi:hypothetical protein